MKTTCDKCEKTCEVTQEDGTKIRSYGLVVQGLAEGEYAQYCNQCFVKALKWLMKQDIE